MTKSASPPPNQDHCGKSHLPLGGGAAYDAGYPRRDRRDATQCRDCQGTFHTKCVPYQRDPIAFVCEECNPLMTTPGVEALEDDEGEETESDDFDLDEDFVPIDEEDDDQSDDEDVCRAAKARAKSQPRRAKPAAGAAVEGHARGSTQEPGSGENIPPSTTRKRTPSTASASASAAPQPQPKRQMTVASTKQYVAGRGVTKPKSARNDDDWCDKDTELLADAVLAFKEPTPARVEKMFNAYAKQDNLHPRSEAILVEKAAQNRLRLATPETAGDEPRAHSSRPRWSEQEHAIIRKLPETKTKKELYALYFKTAEEENIDVSPRTLAAFAQHAAKIRKPATDTQSN